MSTTPDESARPSANQDGRQVITKHLQTTEDTVGLQDKITVEDHEEFIQATSDRLECLRIVENMAGTVAHFLKTRQPGFGDMTGAEILEQQPAELLRRLRQLEEGR